MGVILPQSDVARQIEDRMNVVVRRCRIGKVIEKVRSAPVLHPFRDIMTPQPIYPGVFSLPQMQAKCLCPPGTVCGNVACPHLPTITCAA